MRLKTKLNICRAAKLCCFAGMLGGLGWLFNTCWAILSAPADMTPLWLTWQVAQTCFALAAILTANNLSIELELLQQELEAEAYRRAATSGLMPRDGRHTA